MEQYQYMAICIAPPTRLTFGAERDVKALVRDIHVCQQWPQFRQGVAFLPKNSDSSPRGKKKHDTSICHAANRPRGVMAPHCTHVTGAAMSNFTKARAAATAQPKPTKKNHAVPGPSSPPFH
jgi:hypothetical protein